MMTDDEKEQLLDRCVQGEPLNADEEAQVNQLLRTDADFRDNYQLRQALFSAGVQQRRAAWEARLQTRPTSITPSAFPMRWVAAASVLLLLGIGLLWQIRQTAAPLLPRRDNQALADQGSPVISGQIPLYEWHEEQFGLAGGPDSAAVGTVTWEVSAADTDAYVFSQADTLRLFSRQPTYWQRLPIRLTRLSETRYRLRAGNQTYLLHQGRSLRLPLRPE